MQHILLVFSIYYVKVVMSNRPIFTIYINSKNKFILALDLIVAV